MLLQVEDLHTHLETGDRWVRAVDGVSFAIAEGETFCLVGESGSGKSVTALSVMQLLPQGIARHPAGRVCFRCPRAGGPEGGMDLLTLPESVRRGLRGLHMSMIFQEPMTSLNPVFTVGEQVAEVLRVHRPSLEEAEVQERVVAALAQVGIPQPAQRAREYPHRLSGGQRQRVMIAMAVACEPSLLIADEPTTALDVTVQAQILELMRDLQARNGMAMLFITHDFGVVAQMGHRLGVMRQGRLVEEGTVARVLARPEHPYTRQLIEALPENMARSVRSASQEREPVAPLVRLEGLQVHYPVRKGFMRRVVDHVRAVDGVDLEIPRGRIMALVGESGCGKTTLGRAILRLVAPTGGRILFDGQPIQGLAPAALRPYRRRMQIVFQDPASSLNPRLTVATALTEPMAAHGIGADREARLARAAQVLAQVQLPEESLWRYPHEFSGGQRQRIGIARALVLDPEFLVCDEVTSALDVSVQAEVLRILLELTRARGLTLLFITHDIGVVEYLADDMAVMQDGKVVEQGPVPKVCRAPGHPYTARLLEAVPRIEASPRSSATPPSPGNGRFDRR
ncbi:MAG: ABC transporter ATP-binding protein [Ectothiorhodospira sp.]